MSTDSFSTHSLSDCNSTKLCATETIQAMNRLNGMNLGTAPYNHNMSDINDITASTRAKTRSDTEDFRNTTERTTKVSQLIQYFIQLCQHKIYFTHTHYWLPKHKSDGNAHYSLEDSATEHFLPHWRSDKNKQSNAQWHAQQWQQGNRWRIDLKGRNEVKFGTNEEQY